PRLNLLPILPSSITIPRPPRPTLSPYTTLFRSSTLGKSIPCKKLCYINPIEQHPYFFLFRSQFMAMVKQMLKSQSFKQCRLCCLDRKSTRLNSSHVSISYAVFCLKKKKHTLLVR